MICNTYLKKRVFTIASYTKSCNNYKSNNYFASTNMMFIL